MISRNQTKPADINAFSIKDVCFFKSSIGAKTLNLWFVSVIIQKPDGTFFSTIAFDNVTSGNPLQKTNICVRFSCPLHCFVGLSVIIFKCKTCT